MKTVETERLLLRDFEDRDADPFFEFLSDRECNYLDSGHEPITSKKDPFFRKCMKLFRLQRQERFMIELKTERRCIGTIRIMEADNRKVEAREIAYGICPAYQGQGYATEAVRAAVTYCFADLGVELVTAKAVEPNRGSIRVLEKLGFTREGIRRKSAVYPPVGVVDYVCFYKERPENESR